MKSVRQKAPEAWRATASFRSALAGAALASVLGACSGDDGRALHLDAGASGASGAGGETGGGPGGPDTTHPKKDASAPDSGRGASDGVDASAGGRDSSGGTSGKGAASGKGGASSGGASSGGASSGGAGNGGSAGATGGASTGGVSGAGGSGGAPGTVCGNGVKEAGEECDDGNTFDMDDCTSVCTDNKACLACSSAGTACPHDPSGCSIGSCDTQPYCGDYKDATARQACYSVLSCVVRTQCLFAAPFAQAAQFCFCGAVDAATCQDTELSKLTGACHKEIEAAYRLNAGPSFSGIIDAAGIFNSITDVSIPSGGAMSLASCIADSPCGNKAASGGKCQCVTDHTQRTTQCGKGPATGGAGNGGAGNGGAGNGGAGNGGAGNGGAGNGGAGNGGAGNGGAGNGGAGNGGAGGGGAGNGGAGGGGAGGGGAGNGGAGGTTADPFCGAPFAASVAPGFQGVPAAATTPTACASCEANPMHCPRDPSGCAFGSCDTQPLCTDYKSDADKAACTAVQRCVRQTNCINLSATTCFCGASDLNTCTGSLAGPKGVCAEAIIAGFPTGTTAAAMLSGLFDVIDPGGGAMAIAECDLDNCASDCIPYCK